MTNKTCRNRRINTFLVVVAIRMVCEVVLRNPLKRSLVPILIVRYSVLNDNTLTNQLRRRVRTWTFSQVLGYRTRVLTAVEDGNVFESSLFTPGLDLFRFEPMKRVIGSQNFHIKHDKPMRE